eukprot:jgi/Bigna1/67321/fgenesh1_pg.3_\
MSLFDDANRNSTDLLYTAPSHQLCFDYCDLKDKYGTMDATLKNGLQCVPHQGLHFDGVDDYVDLGDAQVGGPSSFAAWIKFQAFKSTSPKDGFFRIFDFGTNGNTNNVYLSTTQDSNGLIFGVKDTISERLHTKNDFYRIHDLEHVAVTISASGVTKLYLNGTLVDTKSSSLKPLLEVTRPNHYLGKANKDYAYFNGTMRSFSVYHRELSASEISKLYMYGVGDKCFHIRTPIQNNQYYVFEGGHWAEVEEYQAGFLTQCSSASKLVRRSYYRRDTCYISPDDVKKSFKITSAGWQFYADDKCSAGLGPMQTYAKDKCIKGVITDQYYKMIDWSVHTVDDTLNTFLRKVFVPGNRFEHCKGPFYIEKWLKADCLMDKHSKGVWRTEKCLNNVQRKRQDYLDTGCTINKDHEPTMTSLLGRCRQEGPNHLHYWDLGCDYPHQEYVSPDSWDLVYHGDMVDCVTHPHREKTCLQ